MDPLTELVDIVVSRLDSSLSRTGAIRVRPRRELRKPELVAHIVFARFPIVAGEAMNGEAILRCRIKFDVEGAILGRVTGGGAIDLPMC